MAWAKQYSILPVTGKLEEGMSFFEKKYEETVANGGGRSVSITGGVADGSGPACVLLLLHCGKLLGVGCVIFSPHLPDRLQEIVQSFAYGVAKVGQCGYGG